VEKEHDDIGATIGMNGKSRGGCFSLPDRLPLPPLFRKACRCADFVNIFNAHDERRIK